MRYHINDAGKVGICRATVKPCRFGTPEDPRHFDSLEEAEKSSEKILAKMYGSRSTISKDALIDDEVSEILRNASKATYPTKITREFTVERIFKGDSSKLELLKSITKKDLQKSTKAAIGKIALRSDIGVSYNNLNGESSSEFDDGISHVDFIDSEMYEGPLDAFVAQELEELPWLKQG